MTAKGGTPDPTATGHLSHGAVVWDSGVLVFREGLEAILVLAAITASFMGANASHRRPDAAGAELAFAAAIVTWLIVAWALGAVSAPALDVQAATGLLAVAVLSVVMNWFFHRLYWTGWIAHHNRRRRGLLTFVAHHKLPYKRMLVLTGAMIGFVLVVMVGESAQELQLAGWLPSTQLGITLPGWVGTWPALFPTVETIAAQALAAAAVIGSYVVAEHVRVRRPRQR
ncbi:MAG: hypothetical protein WBP81_27460, partial [Solirubrobacteraceae bacterium]